MKILRAVTLWRPWPYCITHLGKPIENRSWECWLKEGDFLAIHAGKRWDKEGAAWVAENFGMIPPRPYHVESAIVAVCRFGGNVRHSASKWFFGPVGWSLYEVVPIEPVKAMGKQGLWKVEGETLEQVRAAYGAAVEAMREVA